MSNMNQILYSKNPTIEGGCTGMPTGLYVGNTTSAQQSSISDLIRSSVHGILNVALDNFDTAFDTGNYPMTFSKVGLCDTGPFPGSSSNNSPEAIIKAVQAVDQLFAIAHKSDENAQVLVHCWSGGSRSVTIAALWMSQRLDFEPSPGQSKLMTAVNMVRKCRQFGFGNPYNPAQAYLPYNINDPDASGTMNNPYPDGKPMAAVFELAQKVDNTQRIPVGKGQPPGPIENGTCPKSAPV